MAWRRKCKGLALNCRTKAKKAGVEGRTAHFFVSIAYGKGVVSCDQYFHCLKGENFAEYVRLHFPQIFLDSANRTAKRFLQDRDPAQNSAAGRHAFQVVGAVSFAIPSCSPDLNPIKNLFHLVSKQLGQDAIDKQITSEKFEQFSERVKSTMMNLSKSTIDRIIESMNKCVAMIIEKQGERLKLLSVSILQCFFLTYYSLYWQCLLASITVLDA